MVIYGIFSKHHNKYVYIGQTIKTAKQRWKEHTKTAQDVKSNCYFSIFSNAIRKYGLENFEVYVLETVESTEDLNKREIFYIKEYATLHTTNSSGCYNLTTGGKNYIACENTRKKLSDLHKGKPKSQEHKQKIKENWIKRRLEGTSNELKRIRSINAMGKNNSRYIDLDPYREEIINLYINEHYTLTNLSKKYKCSEPTFKKKLIDWGVKIRNMKEVSKISLSGEKNPSYINLEPYKEDIIDLYINKKLSLVDIAKEYNCKYGTIRSKLVSWGIVDIRPTKYYLTKNKYSTNFPMTGLLTMEDKKEIDMRWIDRLPKIK